MENEQPLSARARRALIALVLHPDNSSNRTIHDHFGFKIAPAEREELVRHKLITWGTGAHNAIQHQLTDDGLERGREELAVAAPDGAKPADRLLYTTWQLLARSLPHTVQELRSVLLPLRILEIYSDLVTRPGGTIALVDLRTRLDSIDRDELDRALVEMDRRREIQLEPDPDRAALTPEARAAAVGLSGQDMHLMRKVGR